MEQPQAKNGKKNERLAITNKIENRTKRQQSIKCMAKKKRKQKLESRIDILREDTTKQ